jgi:hypothetical protein
MSMGMKHRPAPAGEEFSHSRFSSGLAVMVGNKAEYDVFRKVELPYLALGIFGMARDLANYEGQEITETRTRMKFGLFRIKEKVVVGKRFSSISGFEVALWNDEGCGSERLVIEQNRLRDEKKDIATVLIEPTRAGPIVFPMGMHALDSACATALAVDYYKLGMTQNGSGDGVGGDITGYTMTEWAGRFMRNCRTLDDKDMEEIVAIFGKMKDGVEAEKKLEEDYILKTARRLEFRDSKNS